MNTAKMLDTAAQLADSGLTPSQVARELFKRGFRTAAGSMSQHSVCKMLVDAFPGCYEDWTHFRIRDTSRSAAPAAPRATRSAAPRAARAQHTHVEELQGTLDDHADADTDPDAWEHRAVKRGGGYSTRTRSQNPAHRTPAHREQTWSDARRLHPQRTRSAAPAQSSPFVVLWITEYKGSKRAYVARHASYDAALSDLLTREIPYPHTSLSVMSVGELQTYLRNKGVQRLTCVD